MQDRANRLQEDLRRMRSRPVASDNLDGTRQDAQANMYNTVLDSHLEEQKRSDACAQRIIYGDIFLLLNLLSPRLKVDDAVRNFPDLYLYAGYDCTNKWANFLGDPARKEAMLARLQEALGVTDAEIFFLVRRKLVQTNGALRTC